MTLEAWISLARDVTPLLRRMAHVEPWFQLPDGRWINFPATP